MPSALFVLVRRGAAFRAEVYLDVRFLVARFLTAGFLDLDGAFLATVRAAGLAAGLDRRRYMRYIRPAMAMTRTAPIITIAGR